MMKTFLILIFLAISNTTLVGQNTQKWMARIGVMGTGTSDEGIWVRKDLSNQAVGFTLQNSWGVSADLEFQLNEYWMIGLHTGFSVAGFEIDQGVNQKKTTFIPLLLEQTYRFAPQKSIRPIIGFSGGKLFERDIFITSVNNAEEWPFKFENPFVYGIILGFDYYPGNNWSIHLIIRGLTFDYSIKETAFSARQTLLDQVFWMNYNHIQLGVGYNF